MKNLIAATLIWVAFSSYATNEVAARPASHRGNASVYSDKYIGKKTYSGARYNPNAFTAASPFYPMGTRVRVINERNGKSVHVTINDRQLSRGGRVIDLSKCAARHLGVIGVAPVTLQVVSKRTDTVLAF